MLHLSCANIVRILTAITGEFWTQKAYGVSDNRGKLLRRDGFGMAEDRYGDSYPITYTSRGDPHRISIAAYKPVLEEVEKILAEAGLDEEEMRKGAAGGGGGGSSSQSRNRR